MKVHQDDPRLDVPEAVSPHPVHSPHGRANNRTELSRTMPTSKPNSSPHVLMLERVILELFRTHPTIKPEMLWRRLGSQPHVIGAIHRILKRLVAEGVVVKIRHGLYRLDDPAV
jgi:hypothetical protein